MVAAGSSQLQADESDHRSFVGRARLAYFTPTHDHPQLADRKATFILTTTGLLATVLLFFLNAIEVLIHRRPMFVSMPFLCGLMALGVLLLTAARWAYMGYVLPLPAMPPSLAFYKNIAGLDLKTYVASMYAMDHETALRAVLDYNYSVACQAACKFRQVNRALRCMKYAIPLWMILLLVIAVCGK